MNYYKKYLKYKIKYLELELQYNKLYGGNNNNDGLQDKIEKLKKKVYDLTCQACDVTDNKPLTDTLKTKIYKLINFSEIFEDSQIDIITNIAKADIKQNIPIRYIMDKLECDKKSYDTKKCKFLKTDTSQTEFIKIFNRIKDNFVIYINESKRNIYDYDTIYNVVINFNDDQITNMITLITNGFFDTIDGKKNFTKTYNIASYLNKTEIDNAIALKKAGFSLSNIEKGAKLNIDKLIKLKQNPELKELTEDAIFMLYESQSKSA